MKRRPGFEDLFEDLPGNWEAGAQEWVDTINRALDEYGVTADGPHRDGAIAQGVHQLFDMDLERHRHQQAEIMDKVDCKRGCRWCCYTRVHITPGEALWIADALRDHPDHEKIMRRVAENAQKNHGQSQTEQWTARRACSFLDTATGDCVIWERRPLTCRAYMSIDVRACKRDFYHRGQRANANPVEVPQPAMPQHLLIIAGCVYVAVRHRVPIRALKRRVVSDVSVELNEGIVDALIRLKSLLQD